MTLFRKINTAEWNSMDKKEIIEAVKEAIVENWEGESTDVELIIEKSLWNWDLCQLINRYNYIVQNQENTNPTNMEIAQDIFDNMECNCKNDNEPDECLGMLNGVMNACCGHNGTISPYVQFLDGSTVNGDDAIIIQKILKKQEPQISMYEHVKETKIKEFEIGEYKEDLKMVKTNYLSDNGIKVDYTSWETYQATKFDNWKNYTKKEWEAAKKAEGLR